VLAARSWWAALAVVMVLGGCDSGDDKHEASGLAKGESWEELRQQATEALVRYDEAAAKPDASRIPHASPSATPSGSPFSAVTLNTAGTRLKITFVGARKPAAQPCGIDYSAEAIESDEAVAVIILEQSHGADEVCTMEGWSRTATFSIARPLGGRALLSSDGEPVPVTTTAVTK
jgi:hypothetical protein